MEREYAVGTKDDVTMFIGTEIEHTPAYGMETLFVVGIQDPDEIVQTAYLYGAKHVYLGANQSFEIDVEEDLNEQLAEWDDMVNALRKADLWITLDFDFKYHTIVLESGYSEYDRFIPMISVKLPYINQLGYNACVKIDDTDFRKTNHGVWVHRVHDLQDTSKFTDWSKYTQDKVIK
jgi:hypothetical protein